MHELRLVAVSEDGTYVVLAQPGRAARFSLPNDERLRAVVRGQFSRLAQYEIEVESPLRPKEIQARIRSGETAEQIADAAGVPIERVRWFEGPVLAERAYIAQQAQTASVRRPGDPGPGPRLGEIVTERLQDLGADPEEAQWDSRKRGDGSWLVELTSGAGLQRLTAAWVFDPRRRHAMPDDDEAARLSLPEDALQAADLTAQQAAAAPAGRSRGTVTPFVPRSHPAAARPTAGPDSEPTPKRVSEPVAQPISEPAAQQRAPQQARGAGRDYGAGPDQAGPDQAGPDTTVEPAERSRYSTAQPEPQTSPSAMPRLQPPARGAGREQIPGPAAAQAPEPRPGRPEAPAAGMERRGAPQQGAVATDAATIDQAPTVAEAAQEPPARSRARKAAGGRGRRSSVPTWDEIMFGSSRRQE
jgi:hypothetical protein